MNSMHELKVNKNKTIDRQHNILIFLFIFTFFYTDLIKEIIIQNTGLNIKIFSIQTLIIVYCSLNYNRNRFIGILIMFISLFNIIGIFEYDITISSIIRSMSTILIPLLLFSIKIYNPKKLYLKILKIFNVIVIIYIVLGIIDYITNGTILKILSQLLHSSYYNNTIRYDLAIGVFRWFSLFGHPLVNSAYVLLFLSLNLIYYNFYKERTNVPLYWIYLFSIIGSILSNSKFGLIICILILILNIFNEKRKFIYITMLITIGILILSSSFFIQNILPRFLNAFNSGDITNGRLTVLKELLERNAYSLNFFVGKGMASSDVLVRNFFGSNSGLTNMEIPFLMFLYEYGIFSTIVIYIFIFLYPVYIFLKKRKYYLLNMFLLLFIYFNSFNGIATGTGVFQVYTYSLMILISICLDKY